MMVLPDDDRATDGSVSDDENGGKRSLLDRRSYLRATGATVLGAAAIGTASAAVERHGIQFDRVVDAVADLGVDNTGGSSVQSAIRGAAENNTLVEFPAGTYRLTGNLRFSGLRNFGMVGAGDVRFVTDSGEKILIQYDDVDNGLFENFVLDQRGGSDFVTKFLTSSFNRIQDVEVRGYNQLLDGENVGFKCVPQATSSDARIVVQNFTAAGGGHLGSYIGGGGGMYLGPGHRGTARIIDCHLEEWPNNGIYAGRARGAVQVVGGLFRNSDVSQIRLSGPDSYVRGAVIEVDMSSSDNPGTPQNQRGVLIETGQIEKTGGGVYDCDIRVNGGAGSGNAILVHGNAGYAEIENTRIEVNDGYALRAVEPQYTGGGDRPPAPEPHDIRMRNVSITGDASGRYAVGIEGRPGSALQGCCINQPGDNRGGVRFSDAVGTSVSDSTIDVTGRAIAGAESTSNVSYEGSCPAPSLDPTDGSTDDGTTDDGSTDDGTTDDGTTEEPTWRTLTVENGGTGRFEYAFTVSGDLRALESVDAHETLDGSSVEGVMRSGTDDFEFTGDLTAFSSTGDAVVLIDGERVDLSALDDGSTDDGTTDDGTTDDGTTEEPTWRTLTVENGGTGRFEYSLTVSGDLRALESVDAHETIDGSSVEGVMRSGTDDFEFTGDLTAFSSTGDAVVSIDGKRVDLSALDDGTTDDGTTDDGTTEEPTWNALTVTNASDASRSTYEFTVSGDLRTTESVDDHETIDGSSVEGVVLSGSDDFEFTGEITEFVADGAVDATVNGEPYDVEQLYSRLTIQNGGTGRFEYAFTVSGDLRALESVDAHETIDGSSVEGVMRSGTDDFEFTGDLTAFSSTGDAVVLIDGERVDLSGL